MKFSILTYFAASAFCIASIAQAGVKEGGGGILISAEFATVGRNAIQFLRQGDSKMDVTSIFDRIKEVKVIPVDSICYTDPVLKKQYCEDGHFDKTNNVILLTSSKWDSFSCTEKLVLSSHEFLRAAGYETEDYSYSGRFLTAQLATCRHAVGATDQQQSECSDLVLTLLSRVDDLCRELNDTSKNRSNL